MSDRTIRGKTAIVGLGETRYYKRGAAPDPEFKLTLDAIIMAADDAGIDVRDIDGFASYSNDRNDPPRLANALAEQERGAVGRRARDVLSSDVAVGPGPVLDHDRLAQPLGKRRLHDARRHVWRAAGSDKDDEPDRLYRIVLSQKSLAQNY